MLRPTTPTLLFCGGSDMPEAYYGPSYPASTDCQRLTPEPQDGSLPAYEQDDDMLVGRTIIGPVRYSS